LDCRCPLRVKTAAEHDARRRRLIPSNRTPIGEPGCLRDAMPAILPNHENDHRTGNLRAVQLLLGHRKIESTTPTELIDKLNKEINAGLADPKIKARLADLGGTVLAGTPADFGKLISDETEKWGKMVKFAGIKPE
jgi:Tripartite tricarboxylate transporter family receptor